VVALRSVAGTIAGASEVMIDVLNRRAEVDASGNFVFRSLPAGHFTLTAKVGGRVVTHDVTLPAEPATLRDVAFGTPVAIVESKPQPPSAIPAGAFVVQIGAFRDAGNARQLATRLERLGERPFTDRSEGLLLVRTGPFVSRARATVASQRLSRAGIASYVLTR
jgi:cell division septation protein DedD